MALNPKQRIFVAEYMVDFNARGAAVRAGYSPKTAYSSGQRLLNHVDIQAALQKAIQKQEERTEITADYVLTNIKAMFERCSQGVPVLDFEGNPTGEWKFDSQAALKALELLGKNKKLFTDKTELGNADNSPFMLVMNLLQGKKWEISE